MRRLPPALRLARPATPGRWSRPVRVPLPLLPPLPTRSPPSRSPLEAVPALPGPGSPSLPPLVPSPPLLVPSLPGRSPPTPPPRRPHPRRRGGLFWHRDFRRLWIGETVSQFGTQVSILAMPLVAVVTLKSGAGVVGVLVAMEFAAFLLVGLPAGAWVDRWRRRPVMIAADVVRFALLASVPVAAWAGVLTIWQLYAVALFQGVATVFFDVAYQSYLPSLLGSGELVEGNSKLQGSASVAQTAGPGFAGYLVQALTAPTAVAVNALGFLASAVGIGAIRKAEPTPERPEHPRLRAEIVEGLRVVLRHPILRVLAAATAAPTSSPPCSPP
ncbi:MFS transporter [Catenulispora yoronensis]